jgi:hypothetical protein
MPIHIELIDMHGTSPYKGEDKKITVYEEIFEKVEEALYWWTQFTKLTGLQDDAVESVILATTTEYVGVEAELTNAQGEFSSLVLCIEGTVKKETSGMILFMVEMGNAHVIVWAHNCEGAKRDAQRWLHVDPDKYTVTPLTEPGDRIHFDFSLFV